MHILSLFAYFQKELETNLALIGTSRLESSQNLCRFCLDLLM
jgi:hypothetical protein